LVNQYTVIIAAGVGGIAVMAVIFGADIFEAVSHLNNEQVIAFIISDAEWIDPRLRKVLESYIYP